MARARGKRRSAVSRRLVRDLMGANGPDLQTIAKPTGAPEGRGHCNSRDPHSLVFATFVAHLLDNQGARLLLTFVAQLLDNLRSRLSPGFRRSFVGHSAEVVPQMFVAPLLDNLGARLYPYLRHPFVGRSVGEMVSGCASPSYWTNRRPCAGQSDCVV